MEHGPVLACGELGCREDYGVERDVVLSDELEKVGVLGIEPPLLPIVCEVGRDRDITDGGVEPNVEYLVLVTRLGNGDSPLEVTCYASFLETVAQPALCDLDGVLGPETCLGCLVDPLLQLRKDLGQVQIQVLCLSDDRSRATDHAAGIDQLGRVQKGLAAVALVSSCIRASAVRAGSLDKAVCEEAVALGAVELLGLFLRDVSVGIAALEDVLDDLGLLRGRCASEVVEIDVEPLVDFPVDGMVMVAELTRSHAFLGGSGLGCGSVLVRAADIKGVIPSQAAESGENIGREDLCQVPQMRDVVHIWQCACNKSFFHR